MGDASIPEEGDVRFGERRLVAKIEERKGGRAVEGSGLENRQRGNSFVGSNPTLSARVSQAVIAGSNSCWCSALSSLYMSMTSLGLPSSSKWP